MLAKSLVIVSKLAPSSKSALVIIGSVSAGNPGGKATKPLRRRTKTSYRRWEPWQ